ncbi:MAG: diphthine synthase [Candidatus Aenigmarchaeota archaeon]|nr:diphthine synthase [Candidatus Aenigmarchaeota archaeon]
MSLYFIGLGLYDEKDMSVRALEVAKSCDILFVEFYTQKMNLNIKNLERTTGKKIKILTRKDVEENSEILLEPAKTKKVGFLIGGDPFCATTHTSLRQEAIKRKIKTYVIHGSSIFSAIGETGLHLYKFGSVVTIPFRDKFGNKLPLSVYEKIKENIDRGLHTLILLDIDAEKNKYMNAKEGIETLLDMEKRKKQKIITEDSKIIFFTRAGSTNSTIFYDKIKNIAKRDLGEPPMIIIIPGDLHFTEKEYLEVFRE